MNKDLKEKIVKIKSYADCCAYCGDYFPTQGLKTIDHIKPVSTGGTWRITNLLVCCKLCNEMKSNLFLKDFITTERLDNLLSYLHVIKEKDIKYSKLLKSIILAELGLNNYYQTTVGKH